MKKLLNVIILCVYSFAMAMEHGAANNLGFVPGAASYIFHNVHKYDNSPKACVVFDGYSVMPDGARLVNSFEIQNYHCPCNASMNHAETSNSVLIYYDVNGMEIRRIELPANFKSNEAMQAFWIYNTQQKFPQLDPSIKQKATRADIQVWDSLNKLSKTTDVDIVFKNDAGKTLAKIPFTMTKLEEIKKANFEKYRSHLNSFLDVQDIKFEDIDQTPWQVKIQQKIQYPKATSMLVKVGCTTEINGKMDYTLNMEIKNASGDTLAQSSLKRDCKQDITRQEFEELIHKNRDIDTSNLTFESINQDAWKEVQNKNPSMPLPPVVTHKPQNQQSLKKAESSNAYMVAVAVGVVVCGLGLYKLYNYFFKNNDQQERGSTIDQVMVT